VADPRTIETIDLRKSFGTTEALRGLDLDVPAGSIFGFLGRNGAGKTTTIKILLGMTRPTAGRARVFGLPADAPESSVEIRRRTGFVSEDKELYEYMTVFFSSHQIAEVDQIADRVAIVDRGRAVVAGELEELRERYRRIQLVFDGGAPQLAFRAPGVERMRREGRVLTVLSSAGADRIIDEARALNPVSVDVVPVTLKEIFLETVSAED